MPRRWNSIKRHPFVMYLNNKLLTTFPRMPLASLRVGTWMLLCKVFVFLCFVSLNECLTVNLTPHFFFSHSCTSVVFENDFFPFDVMPLCVLREKKSPTWTFKDGFILQIYWRRHINKATSKFHGDSVCLSEKENYWTPGNTLNRPHWPSHITKQRRSLHKSE